MDGFRLGGGLGALGCVWGCLGVWRVWQGLGEGLDGPMDKRTCNPLPVHSQTHEVAVKVKQVPWECVCVCAVSK